MVLDDGKQEGLSDRHAQSSFDCCALFLPHADTTCYFAHVAYAFVPCGTAAGTKGYTLARHMYWISDNASQ